MATTQRVATDGGKRVLPVLLFLAAALGWGPGPARADVRLGLQTQVEYNDNIFLDETDETEDVIYRVAPWIEATKQWQRLLADFRYQPRFTWYEKNPNLDLTGHNVDLDFSGDLSRNVSLELTNRFVHSEEENRDRFNSQQSSRLPYTSFASTLIGTWLTGRDESLGFLIGGETLDYDEESLSQDGTEYEGRINGRQRVGDLDFATFDLGYAEGEYDDSTTYDLINGVVGGEYGLHRRKRLFARLGFSKTSGDARSNYTTLNPLVGIVGEMKNLRYDIGAGFLVYDQEDADTEYYPSLVANVVAARSWRRGELELTLTSGYEEEFLESESPGFDTYALANITGLYNLAPDWSCNGGCEVRGDSYEDTRPGEVDRKDLSLSVGGGLEYRMMRRATVRLDYTFRVRESEIDTFEYKENSVLMTLNLFTL